MPSVDVMFWSDLLAINVDLSEVKEVVTVVSTVVVSSVEFADIVDLGSLVVEDSPKVQKDENTVT